MTTEHVKKIIRELRQERLPYTSVKMQQGYLLALGHLERRIEMQAEQERKESEKQDRLTKELRASEIF